MRRIYRLPLGERLLWFSSALTSCPGQAPTQPVKLPGEGKVFAVAPTSAITCCAESTPKPGTAAKRTTASWCGCKACAGQALELPDLLHQHVVAVQIQGQQLAMDRLGI